MAKHPANANTMASPILFKCSISSLHFSFRFLIFNRAYLIIFITIIIIRQPFRIRGWAEFKFTLFSKIELMWEHTTHAIFTTWKAKHTRTSYTHLDTHTVKLTNTKITGNFYILNRVSFLTINEVGRPSSVLVFGFSRPNNAHVLGLTLTRQSFLVKQRFAIMIDWYLCLFISPINRVMNLTATSKMVNCDTMSQSSLIEQFLF